MQKDEIPCRVVILPHGEGLPLPGYKTPGAAGMDVPAAIGEDMIIKAGKRVSIPTGLRLEIPRGYEAQIRPRSGLAKNHGITVANAPGTIDSDYRGEVMIILINLGEEDCTIKRGDRIAQMVFAKVTMAALVEADSLSDTKRGAGGFGSTGGGSTGGGSTGGGSTGGGSTGSGNP